MPDVVGFSPIQGYSFNSNELLWKQFIFVSCTCFNISYLANHVLSHAYIPVTRAHSDNLFAEEIIISCLFKLTIGLLIVIIL